MSKSILMSVAIALLVLGIEFTSRFEAVFSIFIFLLLGVWIIYFSSELWNIQWAKKFGLRSVVVFSCASLLALILPKMQWANKGVNVEYLVVAFSLFLILCGTPSRGGGDA